MKELQKVVLIVNDSVKAGILISFYKFNCVPVSLVWSVRGQWDLLIKT